MDITSPISGNRITPATIRMAEGAKMSSVKSDDARKSALNVMLHENNDVEAIDEVDLSPESFGDLKDIFDEAFSYPAPPMPEFKEEA